MQHIFIPYCFDTRGCYANLSGNRKLHLTFHFLPVVGPCGSTWAFSGRSEQGLLFSEVQASHCGGFSCCEAWTLDAQAQQLWPMNLVAPWHVESCLTKDRTSYSLHGKMDPWPQTAKETPDSISYTTTSCKRQIAKHSKHITWKHNLNYSSTKMSHLDTA